MFDFTLFANIVINCVISRYNPENEKSRMSQEEHSVGKRLSFQIITLGFARAIRQVKPLLSVQMNLECKITVGLSQNVGQTAFLLKQLN